VPGTTRDALRESLQIEGVPIVLVDTAGLHASRDDIERMGMERTRLEMARADVVLSVVDAACMEAPDEALPESALHIRVINKIDLLPDPRPGRSGEGIRVSARTGVGLDALRRAIVEAAGWRSGGESVFLARERHLRALDRARTSLEAARGCQAQWELFAEELRLAQEALGEIVGRTSADALLGEIFSRFCIGK
jgi:tRNA modification GTPase